MADNTIRCCFLGGKEGDLYVIGEVHKHADVEIAFVYDPDANSVGLEIAEILEVSVKTVETHRARLMDRLDIHDVPGLVRFAIRWGLVSSDE